MNRHAVAGGEVLHFLTKGDFVAFQTPIDQNDIAALLYEVLRNRSYRCDADSERHAQHLVRNRPCAREDPVGTFENQAGSGRHAWYCAADIPDRFHGQPEVLAVVGYRPVRTRTDRRRRLRR